MVVLLLAGIMAWRIARGGTYYPRAVAVVTPGFLLVAIFVLFFTVPSIGKYVLPAALNVAHSIFMIISTYYVFRITR